MSGTDSVAQIRQARCPSVQRHVVGQEMETGKTYPMLFQDYYSAVTSHFTHSGDRELVRGGGGWGGSSAEGLLSGKTHRGSEHFYF